ncbi:hypothetical protein K2173_004359 [Erythroxylum novogranatense]|uniref:Cysteine proteinase inhibitor n=1 Tax=Erythroxylum novogranatense TaxID=1862640 RepID=A0AAV8T5S7_9ROSI|nr:hypothetical protein K2173_004359 [Erythroxylum novogranatense]
MIETIDAGKKKLYEAKVWIKPWLNFKELQEFKHVEDANAPIFTSSDLGVQVHDPALQDAASHVVDDLAKFNMLLKVKRGSNEEKFKVEVHKNNKGSFHLNQMESHN